MASTKEFVEYVSGQLAEAGTISYKKMFGEYGFYCNGKFFACVCDNQFFVKITDNGQKILKNAETAPPYEGATPYFLITDLDDKKLLHKLTVATCEALPEPKPKKKGKRKDA
ncbi:MAG TPA: competence protein TfoX [Pelotomaculum sp.]|nr:competence protein TfoX [Pelotomaculum sp.]